jgi:hypothetical protein
MWTRRRALIRGSLAVLGAAGSCFAFSGDKPGGAADADALPDGSAVKGLVTLPTDEAIDRGLLYLFTRRNANGSWGTGMYEGNVAVTSVAAMALMAGGHQPHRGVYGPAVTDAVRYVLQADSASGLRGFLNPPRTSMRGPMYGHGFGTLFLAEVSGTVHDRSLRDAVWEKLHQAVRVILDAQNGDGGWRYEPRPSGSDISVTVCQMMALRAARNAGVGVPKGRIDEGVKYIRRCRDEGGWFNYQAGRRNGSFGNFARTAAGVSALNCAGIYKGEEIEKGLEYVMTNRPPVLGQFRGRGFGRADQQYYFYGHYYAMQAIWTAGGEAFANWYRSVRDEFLECQRPDGGWVDGVCPHYATAMACLVLQVPNNYLPIMQK